jgi:hypothetical protein
MTFMKVWQQFCVIQRKWVERFREGETNVNDARYGRPSASTYVQDNEEINQRIWENRRINNDEIVSDLRKYSQKKALQGRFKAQLFVLKSGSLWTVTSNILK